MRNPLTALFGLIALLFLVPSAASAQQSRSAVPDSVHARNHCRLAGQVVRTGQPATKRAWAWAVLPDCGSEGGEAAGVALRGLRASADTAALGRALRVAYSLRDAALFDAAADVAGDAGASPEARSAAFLALVFQVGDRDDYAWFDDLAAPDADRGCPLGSITDRVIAVGAPLPADAVTRARALARATEEGPRTSSVVRVAANCVTRALVDR